MLQNSLSLNQALALNHAKTSTGLTQCLCLNASSCERYRDFCAFLCKKMHKDWRGKRVPVSIHNETVRERIAIIDEDRVVAGHPRPAADRGHDGRAAAHPDFLLHSAAEQRADD